MTAFKDILGYRSLIVAWFVLPTVLQQTNADDLFRERIAPLFSTHCLHCHNSIDKAGEFSLETRAEFIESRFVEPGDPDFSLLVDVITHAEGSPASMPKNGHPLSPEDVAAISLWIEEGARWPDDHALSEPVINDFDWWSLKPLVRPNVPTFPIGARDAGWIRNPIDAFILASQHEHGLSPSVEADRQTLFRRVCYDLTGLPPTPAELDEFIRDSDPLAYEKWVDRLLHSPRYGEHWGRHWLDVVRYADTCGYDKDKLRPNAWPYRDYVIRSFNEDKPYSQFVSEQLAGDVLYPGTEDGVLGLGFIAAGPWDFIGHVEVPEAKLDGKEARNLDRDEMVSATFNVFCSTTVQCARCHNHKFDPVTQEQYYGLQAIFAALDRADRVYATDPLIELQRQKLLTKRREAAENLARLEATIRREVDEALAEQQHQIRELKSRVQLLDLPIEYGYHSQLASTADTEKWIEIAFKSEQRIKQITLYPCFDTFADIGVGFGFPESMTVTSRDISTDKLRLLHQYSAIDGERVVMQPLTIEFEQPVKSQVIRITANQLALRQEDYIFALAELQVFDERGTNIAMDGELTALDSIEGPPRWRLVNLIDQRWPTFQDFEQIDALRSALSAYHSRILQIDTPERRDTKKSLRQQIETIDQEIIALPTGKQVYAAATEFLPEGNFQPTRGTPRHITVLHRGNVGQPGDLATPGVIPLSVDDQADLSLPSGHDEGDRRAALARWVTDRNHPLTWRTIVNRVWLFHFSNGIVETPNDFGRMGQLPSHPELLDWLACEFRDGPQSLRGLHRLIVTSAAYRQSSADRPELTEVDASNRYLWRMNRRRLTAEEIRDSILLVSGRLNLTMGGTGYYLFKLDKTEHSPHYHYHLFDPSDQQTHRRSVYRFVVRSQPDPWMTTLDCADSSQSVPRRDETLTSLQALSLLNNRFTLTMAENFAEQLAANHATLHEQVSAGFKWVTGRAPAVEEQADLEVYAREHGLENYCRVLFNLSEFVFVD